MGGIIAKYLNYMRGEKDPIVYANPVTVLFDSDNPVNSPVILRTQEGSMITSLRSCGYSDKNGQLWQDRTLLKK